jgi:hypothetical protein
MGLVLNDDVEVAAAPVLLGSGGIIYVRPADTVEHYRAVASINNLVAGLSDGQSAAASIEAILGKSFANADFSDPGWIAAIAERLVLIKLTVLCAEKWTGVFTKDGRPAELNEASIAALLRDQTIARRVNLAITAPIHAEQVEGNGSAASPSGGAAADQATAVPAAPPDRPAPKA